MSAYTQEILALEQNYSHDKQITDKINALLSRLETMNKEYVVLIEAAQLLASVSDENTTLVLDYITGIVNKALGEIFPHDSRRVYLEHKLYQGKHAHINMVLTGTGGKKRHFTLQSGAGISQVVSGLFTIAMIEIRKGRRLYIADELFNGLHPVAKRILMDIFEIFAEEGFQFIFVEYGVNDVGRLYLVEKPGAVATVTPMDGKYSDEVFVFNRPPEDVDLSLRIEEGEPDEE